VTPVNDDVPGTKIIDRDLSLRRSSGLPSDHARDRARRGRVAADGDRLSMKLMLHGQSGKGEKNEHDETIRDLMTLLQQLGGA
jgi:hypothetical protein